MALTIKQLSSSNSFLLTFEPLGGNIWQPFRILLDPVLTGRPSDDHKLPHPGLNRQQQACVSSLRDLPVPDLIIISQNRAGHLHEATLRQLPPGSTKTLILAEPSAAKTIRTWGYFDEGIVGALAPWQDPRQTGRDTVVRLAVSPCYLGGDPGEVTVSLIPQKKDIKGVHSAIGITYRPPPSRPSIFRRPVTTPPATPTSAISAAPPHLPPPITDPAAAPVPFTARIVPPTPPDSPVLSQPLRSVRSMASLPPHTYDRTLSAMFSPRGTSYGSLEPYATSHLVSEAALPLTALLHSFDGEASTSPWRLVGPSGAGTPVGQETALALGARAWIGTTTTTSSTHDDDDEHPSAIAIVEGKHSRLRRLQRRRRKMHSRDQVRESLRQAEGKERKTCPGGPRTAPRPTTTRVLDLGSDEQVTLTSEGVWDAQPAAAAAAAVALAKNGSSMPVVPDALGVFDNFPI